VRSRRAISGTAAAIVVATVIGLSGCGGSSGGDDAASGATVDEQVGLEGDAILERQARAETLIRDCMKTQGFDYVPVDPVAQQAALTGSRNLTEEEFNRQFGYGITTLYEQRLEQATTGPNARIRAALGPVDQAAYDRALYGDDPTATFAVALDTGDFGRLGGCLKQATERVFGGTKLLESLTSRLDDLDERILADARMVDAVKDWSNCMRTAGYEVSAQDEVDEMLQSRLEEIVGPLGDSDGPLSESQRAALRTLQREEVAMVQQDINCEEQHITAVEERVRAGYEQEFQSRNAALLRQVPAR
jgi:hypothetical protein